MQFMMLIINNELTRKY